MKRPPPALGLWTPRGKTRWKKLAPTVPSSAQRRLRPEEVLPEWQRQLQLIGDEASIARFVRNACSRLNAPLEPTRNAWRFNPRHLPSQLKERLDQESLDRELTIDFHYPPNPDAQFIHRTHPLVAILADTLLEGALQDASPLAARCAATVSADVTTVTTLFLLRLRHQLSYKKREQSRTLMAEETLAVALEGRQNPRWLSDSQVIQLLDLTPSGNLGDAAARKEIEHAITFFRNNTQQFEGIASQRADALLADHRRVREAARDLGSYEVNPCLPVDLIGVLRSSPRLAMIRVILSSNDGFADLPTLAIDVSAAHSVNRRGTGFAYQANNSADPELEDLTQTEALSKTIERIHELNKSSLDSANLILEAPLSGAVCSRDTFLDARLRPTDIPSNYPKLGLRAGQSRPWNGNAGASTMLMALMFLRSLATRIPEQFTLIFSKAFGHGEKRSRRNIT